MATADDPMHPMGGVGTWCLGRRVCCQGHQVAPDSDSVNVVTACPVCSKQCSRQLPGEGGGAVHWRIYC